MKPTHMFVGGSTQTGKTTYCNQLHRRFQGVSVFVDTKGIDPIWGVKTRSLRNLSQVLVHGKKIVWDPPRRADGLDQEAADAELLALWGKAQSLAMRSKWTSARAPWLQVIVDESQLWEDASPTSKRPNTLEDMAARGLGMGVRLVCATQHPAGMRTRTRANLDTRVVFRLGDEGRRCIDSWGWPADEIAEWTKQEYHFASTAPQLGWRYHAPIPLTVPAI